MYETINTDPVAHTVTDVHSLGRNFYINGLYLRNGPNNHLGDHLGEHLFDGDGMIHHTLFDYEGGLAVYGNDYVETNRFKNERKHRTTLFHRIGQLNLATVVWSFFKRLFYRADPFIYGGGGNANTSVVYHAGRILSLNEADYPYEVKYDRIEKRLKTVGRYTFDGKLTHHVNAHPKIDPVSGAMYMLGYDLFRRPFCHLSYVNPHGELIKTVGIDMPRPTVIHDLGLTKNYVIIFDTPLTWSMTRLLTFRNPVYFDTTADCRIGLFNRSTGTTKWFKLVERTVVFHIVNAWEDGNMMVIYAVCYDPKEFDLFKLDKQRPILKTFRFNLLDDPQVTSIYGDAVSYTPCEFPVVSPADVGRPTRDIYYLKIGLDGFDGICHYNVLTKKERTLQLKYGLTCSEVCVLENDYLLTYVYNYFDKRSSIHVYDGKTMNNSPILNIPLNHRIPFGFHGVFIKHT
jgi:carotenoid cleavage dioxygenase-like enzyme